MCLLFAYRFEWKELKMCRCTGKARVKEYMRIGRIELNKMLNDSFLNRGSREKNGERSQQRAHIRENAWA